MKISRFINIMAAASIMLAALGASYSPAVAQGEEPKSEYPYVPGEVVVGFKYGTFSGGVSAEATALASKVNADVVDQNGDVALLSFDADKDVNALVAEIQMQEGVTFAEPNYIYSLPEARATPDAIEASDFHKTYVLRHANRAAQVQNNFGPKVTKSSDATFFEPSGPDIGAVSVQALQAMRTVNARGRITATYPTDTYLWWGGWSWIGADIVWPNTTASAGICEIDTGVDYLHPDLSTNIIKGYDFVNADLDPMDDNGHGTHVAGIMVALKNNAKGIAGVSTGKVVAVKALDAQGFGTNMDIAAAINYCATRTDVRVINLSLGGPHSIAMQTAVNNAVNVVGSPKLIVAAAGNDGTDVPSYPAAYSVNYPNMVLAVAASGYWYQPDPVNDPNWWVVDYSCRAGWYDDDTDTPTRWSNYGSWVNVVAPGSDIYSTTPWDKTFWLNTVVGVDTRYAAMDGTSMASPYVAAVAARRWGYKPLENNAQVGSDVITVNNNDFGIDTNNYTGDPDPGTAELGECWPASMTGVNHANVAAELDRGAIFSSADDALIGTPLAGATIQVFKWPSTAVAGSGVVSAYTFTDRLDTDPTRVYSYYYSSYTDIINLAVDYTFGYNFYTKANKTGYTASAQSNGWWTNIYPGSWSFLPGYQIPPKSANFDIVAAWRGWNYSAGTPAELDLDVWLPLVPGLYSGQPANFLVGNEGSTYGEVEPIGGMTYFPYARLKRDGGTYDGIQLETLTIRNRYAAHDGFAVNAALPYYPGTYTVNLTDNGLMSSGHHLLGYDAGLTQIYVWKDGLIKWSAYDSCEGEWWGAFMITSGPSGAVTYGDIDACNNINPYGPN